MNNKCPKCGGELSCLAGSSAHPDNWYCDDTDSCGWQAWDRCLLEKGMNAELIDSVMKIIVECDVSADADDTTFMGANEIIRLVKEAENVALKAQVNELRNSLSNAVLDISDWGAYASDYFKEKHNLQGIIKDYESVVDKTPEASLSTHNKKIRDEVIDECGRAVGKIKAKHWIHGVNNPAVEVLAALKAISALKEITHE